MSVETIEMWHRRVRPAPTERNFLTQIGCHFEEVAEMMEVLRSNDDFVNKTLRDALANIQILAHCLKQGDPIEITDRGEFLDAMADQVVTAVGTAYCAGMKPADAITAVNVSNWSKFDDDGEPIFDGNGKIKKGPNYKPPSLDGMY